MVSSGITERSLNAFPIHFNSHVPAFLPCHGIINNTYYEVNLQSKHTIIGWQANNERLFE